MNDEQKRKEDLEAAKDWLAIAKKDNNTMAIQILEDLFPELRESDDERIRKEIIAYLDVQEVLAQGKDGDFKEWIAWLEKQGEQKSADSYCQENCKGFQETGKCFADGECKAKREAGQKPTWSEEDEKMKSLIISTLTSMGTLNLERYHHMNLDEVKNWLTSLKDRVQPQQK